MLLFCCVRVYFPVIILILFFLSFLFLTAPPVTLRYCCHHSSEFQRPTNLVRCEKWKVGNLSSGLELHPCKRPVTKLTLISPGRGWSMRPVTETSSGKIEKLECKRSESRPRIRVLSGDVALLSLVLESRCALLIFSASLESLLLRDAGEDFFNRRHMSVRPTTDILLLVPSTNPESTLPNAYTRTKKSCDATEGILF